MKRKKTINKYNKGGTKNYNEAYKKGYDKGYNDGYNDEEYNPENVNPDGYDEGYTEGLEEKKNEVREIEQNISSNSKKEINNKNIYPIYTDKNFSNNITNRIELQVYNLKEEDTCEKKEFILAPYQIFLKNLISRETPYKSLLIYHGTGVGKTCSAVSIAENFKDIYKNKNKKIIILLPDSVREGWRNNIHNPNADINQCTGQSYENDMSNLIKNKYIERNQIKDRKKVVNYYYEFYGYRGFVNKKIIKIKEELNNKYLKIENPNEKVAKIKKEFIKIIKENFSNKVLIIDEVHNIRNIGKGKNKEDIDSEKIYEGLEEIIRYSENLKLIMLSATPMYNESIEIVKLINFMLLNDNRETINKKEIFTIDNKVKKEGLNILLNNCKGYISYIRGETPNKFPLRLYPIKENNDNGKIKYYNNVKNLDNYLELYTCLFEDFQKNLYEESIKEINVEEEINLGKGTQLIQISNIVYPNVKKDKINATNYKNCYGKIAKNKFFSIANNKYKYKKDSDEIFRYDLIGNYSKKIELLLKQIKESEGIIFIYSRFIEDGVIPIILALEQNGYINYSGINLLNTKNKTDYYNKTGNKFIVITGNTTLTKNKDEYIRKLLDNDNINGEKIKIIIGSEVASEGLDLKRIREIHVIDPWYHLNRLEQIVGRGIRYCSHEELEKEKRNVTIFLYAGIIKECENIKNCNDSIDVRIYDKAVEKSKNIGLIEKILKESAIDCNLFLNMNKIESKKETIITSTNKIIKNYIIEDKPFSKICSYQEDCEYKCNNNKKVNQITNTADINLLKNIYPLIIKVIKELFEKQKIWYINEDKENNIIKEIKKRFNNINNKIIELTLNYLINKKITLNINNTNGYIYYYENHLIFKVECLSNDINYSYYENNNNCQKIERYIDPNKYNIIEEQVKENKAVDILNHYAEIFIEKDNNYIQANNIDREIIIKSLSNTKYNRININDIFGFNYKNKTKSKGNNELLFQILQPPSNGNKECKSGNKNILTETDRKKTRISGRGAIKDTFPLPYSGNACGDGNQSGFNIRNPCWYNRYKDIIDNLSESNKKDTTLIMKLIIIELFSEYLEIKIEDLNKIQKKHICYIIEFILRYKENNKTNNNYYYINYDKLLLPLFNNPQTIKIIKNKTIEEINNNLDKIIKDNFNDKIKSKNKKIFDFINSENREKIQYAYERLNIEEKHTYIEHILNKIYNKKEKLVEKEEYILDYVKDNFIYKEKNNYRIDKKDIKPYGYYLFN